MGKPKMKKLTVLFLVISLLAFAGNLSAQQGIKSELSLGGGSFLGEGCSSYFGAASLGFYSKMIGAELSGAILGGGAVVDVNLSSGPFEWQHFIPYATSGIWTTTSGGFGFNVGGGIKIKLSDEVALRVEYRRYLLQESDWGLDAIIGGISLFILTEE
jgi:hypothetical protein